MTALTHNRLRQVAVLAELGSFRRAAARLGISQPALSKGIQALEAALGVTLFDRGPRSVTPTEFGKRLLAHIAASAAAEDDLLRDIASMRGLDAGGIDVALGPYPAVVSGYAAAARVLASHPKLSIALRVADWREVTQRVAQRRSDIGLAELSDAVLNDALDTELVGRHRARLFCRPGHPILSRKRVSVSDLMQFPWVYTRVPPRIAAALPRAPTPAGRIDELTADFVPAVSLDVPMLLAGFLAEGDALAFGSLAQMERELEAGAVAVVATNALDPRGSYGFISLRNRSLSPGVRAYMDAIREQETLFAEREARLEKIYG